MTRGVRVTLQTFHCKATAIAYIGRHGPKLACGRQGAGNDLLILTRPVSPARLPPGPQDNTIRSLATVAADHIVTVDLVVVGQAYCDIATLGELATTTGGTVYCYTPYNPLSDFDQLVNDLSWNVARLQVGHVAGSEGGCGPARARFVGSVVLLVQLERTRHGVAAVRSGTREVHKQGLT